MGSYRLVDVGFPYRKIMHGRKWVGRVYQHADGSWHAMINKQELASSKTPVEAFERAVAKHLGYANVGELNERNRQVRAEKLVRRRRADAIVQQFMHGKTIEERFKALDKMEAPDQLIDTMDAFIRSLRK